MHDVCKSFLNSIDLFNFRNHSNFVIDRLNSESVVITGRNGLGKTNILEAISLLSATKGLRGAKISDLNNLNNTEGNWRIKTLYSSKFGLKEIISSRNVSANTSRETRTVQIDGNSIKKKSELNDILKIVWLTPPMQQLFVNSSKERRAFFDHIVSNFFSDHIHNLGTYDKYMKERLKLLKENKFDKYWLSALEQNMNNYAKLISDARMQTLSFIQNSIDKNPSPFAKAEIFFVNEPLQNDYLELLEKNRKLDSITGRTNSGPHLFDINTMFKEKNMPAKFCSTGEQKTLLLNIILAQVSAIIERFKITPIVLLDEVISHLDDINRKLLFDEIIKLDTQTWFSGLDPKSFKYIENYARFITVE